ncbi:hypothetical protein GW17_00002064 [Ensete ventricosum]|nr:hypothetical protein GW17_00002064 [Ensete ventricosum]RZR81042.1 hypothetical protein BHM03_00007182 [Ensete ventricosum]
MTLLPLGVLLLAAISPVFSETAANHTFRPGEQLRMYRRIRAHVKRLNKPPVKTIQDPPERPRGHNPADTITDDSFQLWRTSGESCPDGTVAIKRTKEEDVLRASSVKRFGRKPAVRTRHDSESSGHELGSGVLIGYWPSFLFTHLSEHASMVQFGGEVVNTQPLGLHTATEMGSGHFAGEGFGKASYFRSLQVVDWDNSLIPVPNLRVLADHPSCYDIHGGINRVWGNYFYYGGPGRSHRCS